MTLIDDKQHFDSLDQTVAQFRKSFAERPTLFPDALKYALRMSDKAMKEVDLTAQTVAYFAVFGMSVFNRIELERETRKQ